MGHVMTASFKELQLPGLECSTEDGIGWLYMNRAPVNAMDMDFLHAFAKAVQVARNDAEVRVVVIASKAKNFFSAGLDLKELDLMVDEGRADLLDQVFKDGIIRGMRTARKIFIALVGGHCLGGGLELALAADFRVGAQGKWQLGLPEVKLGGMPGGGGIQTLRRLIGQSRALRMAALGETMDPTRAHEYGILDALHPEEEAMREVTAFAAKFAQGAPQSIGAVKLALYEGMESTISEAMVLERQLYRAIMKSEDIKEGVAAFREKRVPKFTGR